MSPRGSRDIGAIQITDVRHDGSGRGIPEDGGGPLAGGLVLKNRFEADVVDPAIPFKITVTVHARGGALACEAVTIAERPTSPSGVVGTVLRALTVDSYVRRIREELGKVGGGLLIVREHKRTDTGVSFSGVPADRWRSFESGQRSDAVSMAARAAAAYREALASPNPAINRAPTAAVASALNVARGHASRLLTRARREGLLAPARKGRAGEFKEGSASS